MTRFHRQQYIILYDALYARYGRKWPEKASPEHLQALLRLHSEPERRSAPIPLLPRP